ncbi:MAG: type II toxin-antitoxin system RelE/ParE family toxin [Gammaproteobacteria bacterium]|jgi:phage-related protein|nr:type II toxin-antitoxin system RelE/ParE family toxin [Gammaproteobacteria bacterium]
MKKITARFYRSASGNQPVRDWLYSLNPVDMKIIGTEVKTVEFGWPIGMPLVRKIKRDLWEVRCHVSNGIARVLFTVIGNEMVLLHGIIKKSQKIPLGDLETTQQRLKEVQGNA